MIRRIICFFLLLLPFCLAAEPVSPERAKKIAGDLLKAQGGRALTIRRVEEPQYLTKSSFYAPSYYVFEGDRGGFVILAADDRVNPVIGWSREGEYIPEDIPANMRGWLGMWEEIIDKVKRGELAPQKGAGQQWAALEKEQIPCYDNEVQYETAKWGQDDPFNKFCPEFDGVISATGCVATATAIVMRYHQWPEAGHGELPSYTYVNDANKERTVYGITLGNEYDWENMPLKIDAETTDEQKEQIARLMADVGIMAQASYYPAGTGALPKNAAVGLIDHFYYDPSIFNYLKEYFSDQEWLAMLKENLDNVGPIVYSGYDSDGGHSFVLDGYNSKGEFSINWGWRGRGDGFFSFPAFDTFTIGHQAVVNMKKDEGGSEVEFMVIEGNGRGKGLTSETKVFEVGEPFDLSCMYVFNLGARDFVGDFALAVVHRDGSMGEILDQTEEPWTIESYYGQSIICSDLVLTEPTSIGDHIRLFFRSEKTPEWTLVPANKEDKVSESIPIADTRFLDEATSFRYTSASRVLAVTTKKDAKWVLADADGNQYTDGVEFNEGVITINTDKFPLKSYFLTLTKEDDSKTIEFVFGEE